MTNIDIRPLETSFRGYPRKNPGSWALHYNITFACFSEHVPDFLAEQLTDVKGYFQLPQHSCPIGLWGQFQEVDVRSDNEIGLGPRRAWHTHGRINVAREMLWDAWARVKLVYSFERLDLPVWFKRDVAFRAVHVENSESRWGNDHSLNGMPETSFCYFGNQSAFSVETSLTGRADWSVAGLTNRWSS